MKIGFTGAQGTGKTTACLELVCELKKHGYNAELVTEAARSCPLPINEKATINSQLWIFGEILKREQECSADILVCDRTLLDVLAYTKRISEYVAEELKSFIRGYIHTYDIIFYMSPNSDYLKDDGKRSINKIFQKEIKNIIDEEIFDMNINVFNVDSKTRLQIVLDMLREDVKK